MQAPWSEALGGEWFSNDQTEKYGHREWMWKIYAIPFFSHSLRSENPLFVASFVPVERAPKEARSTIQSKREKRLFDRYACHAEQMHRHVTDQTHHVMSELRCGRDLAVQSLLMRHYSAKCSDGSQRRLHGFAISRSIGRAVINSMCPSCSLCDSCVDQLIRQARCTLRNTVKGPDGAFVMSRHLVVSKLEHTTRKSYMGRLFRRPRPSSLV